MALRKETGFYGPEASENLTRFIKARTSDFTTVSPKENKIKMN